jgi:hypothetical protein
VSHAPRREGRGLLVAGALDLLLEPRYRRETFIPTTFEFAGDQPVIGIDRIILSARMRRFIARLFQGEFTLPQPFHPGTLAIRNQLQCSIEGQW